VFFQTGLSYSAFQAGLMFLPFAIGFSAAAIVSGPIANRIGPWIINLGSFFMALGLSGIIVLAQLANAASPPLLITSFVVAPAQALANMSTTMYLATLSASCRLAGAGFGRVDGRIKSGDDALTA